MYSHDWWGWFVPGLLMSITIDVGLLAFVTRLQNGERQGSLIVGYLLLCGLMAFGQFVYVASHIANFTLAAGVADYYHDLANGIIKAALFVYPAALPVVSAVYAFSVRQKPPTPSIEAAISVDGNTSPTAVKFMDVGSTPITSLPTMDQVALPPPETVKSDDQQLIALEDGSTPVEQQQNIDAHVETSALITPKREYSIRTAEHHCAHCGVAFTPTRSNQRYHSDSCRVLASQKRKAEQHSEATHD
jgi:hypothetical protein